MRYARNAYILAAAAWVVAAIAVLFAVFAERTVATAADEGSRSVVERRQRDRRNAAVAFFAAAASAKDGEDYRAAAVRAAKSEPTAHVGGDRDRINVNSADRALLELAAAKAGYREPKAVAANICAWRGDRRSTDIPEEAFDYFAKGYPLKGKPLAHLAELSLVKAAGDDPVALARLKTLLAVRGDDTIDIRGAGADVLSCVYAYYAGLLGLDASGAGRYAAYASSLTARRTYATYAAFFEDAVNGYAGGDRDMLAAVLSAAKAMSSLGQSVAEVSFGPDRNTVFRFDLRAKRMRAISHG